MNQNSDLKEWLVIVNPNAGNGKGKKDWDRISDLFEKNNICHISPCSLKEREMLSEFVRDAY